MSEVNFTIEQVGSEISCIFSLPRSDSCTLQGSVRVNGISGTISVAKLTPDRTDGNGKNRKLWKLKPYARKTDNAAMNNVRNWSIKSVSEPDQLLKCLENHTTPAIIFSNGGYSGNHFHDFTDTLIPLFLSAKRFNGNVKFLVTDYKFYWINKYRKILQKLSKYEIINIDNDKNIHCFPVVILGLTSQKEFDLDSSMPPYSSVRDFTAFVRDTYALPRSNEINLKTQNRRKLRLMIISRKATRRLINKNNVVETGKKLGYQVIVAEGKDTLNLSKFAESVNSCDVLIGIHGAGLTNMVFLPENAVVVQIVPLGLENISNTDFGQPARDMNLKYLEYKVTKEESSLIEKYPVNNVVFRDPRSILRRSWLEFKAIYLDNQDIRVDVGRLQPLLEKVMQQLQE